MFQIGERLRARVEKLVFGGKGLIRHEGWVIFVADVVPGEVVEVEITAKKKSYFEAALQEVIEASPNRVIPPCPYFGTCGGCQLQHIAYDAQVSIKKEWLVDALERAFKSKLDFPVDVTPAKKEWAYRQKVTLHGPECGFYARDNATILPIERCLIFSEKSFDDVRSLATKETTKSIVMRNEQEARAIVVDNKICLNQDIFERQIEGLQIFFSPTVFIQNNPEMALQIYKDVLGALSSGPVLDLYCGVGVLSLLAAKEGKKVVGVELDAEAIKLAKQSAKANSITSATFYAMPCEKIEKLALKEYENWIVNPPRTGLSEKVIQIIAKNRPKELVYISCMPATLARDLKMICEAGYTIKRAHVYDMFAETCHLETVVTLTL